MNTDDEMGTCYDNKSQCSDMSLRLDDSFFRYDSLSLPGNVDVSIPVDPVVDYHVYSEAPPLNPQRPFSYVEDEEGEEEDDDYEDDGDEEEDDDDDDDDDEAINAKSKGSNGASPYVSRRLRTKGKKTSSFDHVRVSRENRQVIQHNYHDHAFDPDDTDILKGRGGSKRIAAPFPVAKKKGGVAVPFPLKLHELLEKAEEENLTNIVSWQSHGRAFVVHDPKMFVRHLMPR